MAVLTDTRMGLLRYTTSTYIADDPVSFSLQRKVAVPKPGGGHDKMPVTIAPQTFRLINQTVADGVEYSGNDEGTARKFSYVMVGNWDANIQVDDSWTEGDLQYHVDGLVPSNGYETRAYVTAFGKEPQHG